MHSPEAIVWNDFLFGRDTHVVPSNIVLEKGLGPR